MDKKTIRDIITSVLNKKKYGFVRNFMNKDLNMLLNQTHDLKTYVGRLSEKHRILKNLSNINHGLLDRGGDTMTAHAAASVCDEVLTELKKLS